MQNFVTGLNNELESRFGNLTLGDVKNISGCIPAAVARQTTEGNPDYLEIFDSRKRWQENLLVKDILRATTNAPTYFETPIKIGNQDYVDGGVSGTLVYPINRYKLIAVHNVKHPQKINSQEANNCPFFDI